MSLLSICQGVARITPVAIPATIVGAADETASLLLECAQEAGESLYRAYDWIDLITEYTFNVSSGTADYALPSDYGRFVDQTLWDRSNYEELRGPLSAQKWQEEKSGILANTATAWKRYRVHNVSGTKYFSITPTPDATESLVYEYVSKNWCESSGGSGQNTWAADTDVGVIDEYLIKLHTKWRFFQRLGMSYEEEFNEAERETNKATARDGGSPILSITKRMRTVLSSNTPESGFGS